MKSKMPVQSILLLTFTALGWTFLIMGWAKLLNRTPESSEGFFFTALFCFFISYVVLKYDKI